MDAGVVEAFHAVSRLRREDLFDDDRMMPLSAPDDARTAATGWVGSDWNGGTVLIGINPGGGGDDYRRNPADDELYGLLRALRKADCDEAEKALARVSAAWMRIQRTHNIWRIIGPILDATGEQPGSVAFLNVLPFRTRMDRRPSVKVLRRAWDQASGRQIAVLRPTRVIALGKKAWEVLSRFSLPGESELVLFKRGIGDSYIPPESKAVLQRLAQERAIRATGTSAA